MSSLARSLSGDVLVFDLGEERELVEASDVLGRAGRNARTLLKHGSLRVTLVVLAPGGEIAEHQAEGSITVQPLEGRIRFTALGRDHELGPGQLLSAAPGVRHAVASEEGATFLLTLSLAPTRTSPTEP